MSSSEVSHPLFARFYTRFSGYMEREVGRYRAEIVEGLDGRVLEIGAGNGMNFAHYGDGIDEVVALEPESYMRSQARIKAETAKPKISVVEGNATDLPFEDDSFDHVVICMVMCSIDDPARALSEARRVVKADGSVRFLEHVRSPKRSKARVQSLLDRSRIWPSLAGGCHCSRDTVGEMEQAGFRITLLKGFDVGPKWGHTNPHVIGRATPR